MANKYFVVGDDLSLQEGLSREEIESAFASEQTIINAKANKNEVNNGITTFKRNGIIIGTIAANQWEVKTIDIQVPNISSGTAEPSGGSNGDIYIQYE